MNWLLSLLCGQPRGKNHTRSRTNPSVHRCRPTLEGLEDRVQLSTSPIGLGDADQFAVLGLNNGRVSVHQSAIVGDIGVGPNATSVFRNTREVGTLHVDPSATVNLPRFNRNFVVTGGVVQDDLSQEAQDAMSASTAYAAMTPTQTYGNVTRSLTIAGNGATNVININSLNYFRDNMTLSGGANDVFIINVARGFHFHQSTITLQGGVTADHVLFNFARAGSEIELDGRFSVVNGTFLAPFRRVDCDNLRSFNGAIIARGVSLEGCRLNFVGFAPPVATPAPNLASLSGYVFADNNYDGVLNDGDTGLAGVTLTLTGTDSQGNWVSLTVTTDAQGFYRFDSLPSGTYMILASYAEGFMDESALAGSLGGNAYPGEIADILVEAGAFGDNYNFAKIFSGENS
jgi:hypothetical protein